MKRTLITLLVGIAIGMASMIALVEITGGWYTYFTLPPERCQRASGVDGAQVVPHQPNPCHFRERRWSLIN